MEWELIGDVNPLEHGGTWIKKDEGNTNSFYVVDWKSCEEVENRGYLSDVYVDLDDSWINWEEVKDYADLSDNESSETLAKAVFDYYGIHIDGRIPRYISFDEVREELKNKGITLSE